MRYDFRKDRLMTIKLRMIFYIGFIFQVLNAQQACGDDFQNIENAPATSSHLQDDIFKAEEGSSEVIKNLTILREQGQPRFNQRFTKKKFKRSKTQQKETFKAYLKVNSILHKYKNSSRSYRIKRQLFVSAHARSSGGIYSYIFDSQKNIKFITETKNLIDISKDLKLTPSLPSREEFGPPGQRHSTNKFQQYENAFYLKIDSLNLGYYNDLLQTSGLKGLAERYEYNIFMKWNFPIDFGLVLSYEQGISEDQGQVSGQSDEQLLWSAFYFGPAVKYLLSENKVRRWEIHLGFQKSFNHSATQGPRDFSFSTNALELDLLWKRKTKWGIFIIGGNMRQLYMSLDSRSPSLARTPRRSTVTSLGASLGYQFSFKL